MINLIKFISDFLTFKFSRINTRVLHSLKYDPSFRTCMDSKSAIFIAVGSLLVMAIYSPIMNFVSAATSECFGFGQAIYYCVATAKLPNGEDYTILLECNTEKVSCEKVERVQVTPPGLDQIIQDTVNEVGPSNPNDSKDLGGMKTDKGITKSPIE